MRIVAGVASDESAAAIRTVAGPPDSRQLTSRMLWETKTPYPKTCASSAKL
jgi:hypothetical protein